MAGPGPFRRSAGLPQVISPGQFRLALTHFSETPAPLRGRLSRRLRLVVTEIDRGPQHTGLRRTLSDLGVRDVSMLEPGEKRRYHVEMSFPGTGPHGADNVVQGGRVEAYFLWTGAPAR